MIESQYSMLDMCDAAQSSIITACTEPPEVKPGDVWALGRHRLMCGDSTDPRNIAILMNGKKWDSSRPDIMFVFDIAPLVCIWGGNYFADILPITNDWLIWHKRNDGLDFSECEMAWTNFGINCRHISHHWSGEEKLHITMKPLAVIGWAIGKAKKRAELIVDVFGGSGTTLIACEQMGRTCYTMEIDPHYCGVIIDRWQRQTGQNARLVERMGGRET